MISKQGFFKDYLGTSGMSMLIVGPYIIILCGQKKYVLVHKMHQVCE